MLIMDGNEKWLNDNKFTNCLYNETYIIAKYLHGTNVQQMWFKTTLNISKNKNLLKNKRKMKMSDIGLIKKKKRKKVKSK